MTGASKCYHATSLPIALFIFIVLLCALLSLFTATPRLILSSAPSDSTEPAAISATSSPQSSKASPVAAASTSVETGGPASFLNYAADLVDYPVPKLDLEQLSKYPPHNYIGPGRPAYATFFTARNVSLHDPLFIAAQQLVYRILWANGKKTEQYPVVVFVLPFVPDTYRLYFAAAGAIVRELEVREFNSEDQHLLSRYHDQFAKINMWRHTDFSDLLYLDADATPWKNMDEIFDTPVQRCNVNLLPGEDAVNVASICDYRFAAWVLDFDQQINAGVMLLRPDHAMFERLMRELAKIQGGVVHDNEQGFLNATFADDGPFPRRRLGDEWNGGHARGSDYFILHGKSWMFTWGEVSWIGDEFNQTWFDLLALYESPKFRQVRIEDRERAMGSGSAQR